MENNNQNKDNQKFNLGSGETSIDLKSKMPEWLQGFFTQPNVCKLADINDGIIEGYPNDDDF